MTFDKIKEHFVLIAVIMIGIFGFVPDGFFKEHISLILVGFMLIGIGFLLIVMVIVRYKIRELDKNREQEIAEVKERLKIHFANEKALKKAKLAELENWFSR